MDGLTCPPPPGHVPLYRTFAPVASRMKVRLPTDEQGAAQRQKSAAERHLTLELEGRPMHAYWSADGRRPMPVVVDFVSIVARKKNKDAYAEDVWSEFDKQGYNVQSVDGHDVMEIAELKKLLRNLPPVKGFPKHNSDPYRRDIRTALIAFEEGDTTMLRDAGAGAARVNTTNRQVAATSMQNERFDEALPAPTRQKLIPSQRTFALATPSSVSAGSSVPNPPYESTSKNRANMNGAGRFEPSLASSTRSAASAMQVRLLVRSFDCTAAACMLTRPNNRRLPRLLFLPRLSRTRTLWRASSTRRATGLCATPRTSLRRIPPAWTSPTRSSRYAM